MEEDSIANVKNRSRSPAKKAWGVNSTEKFIYISGYWQWNSERHTNSITVLRRRDRCIIHRVESTEAIQSNQGVTII